jgi:hypothetical protein
MKRGLTVEIMVPPFGPCLDCESKGTFQSYAGSINKVYSTLFFCIASFVTVLVSLG